MILISDICEFNMNAFLDQLTPSHKRLLLVSAIAGIRGSTGFRFHYSVAAPL